MPMPELHTAPALSRLCGIFYAKPKIDQLQLILSLAQLSPSLYILIIDCLSTNFAE